MKIFSPYKKHANRFNYIPRYYDPAKEAREQRRAELRGERSGDAEREYTPGQYIRTQRDARAAQRAGEEDGGRSNILKMAAIAVLAMLFIYMLYPRLADVLMRMSNPGVRKSQAVGEFDASLPITVVPNDYQE